MNQNLYQMPDDIRLAQEKLQRVGEGRRLANLRLHQIADGMLTHAAPWNGNQLACVCEAAVHSASLERIARLEREIDELRGLNSGLQFQVGNNPMFQDSNAYQQECLRTAKKGAGGLQLCLLGLGLTGEAGQVADHLKKAIGHGHQIDATKVAKELGDTLWYLSVLSYHMGFELSEIMGMNVQKLRKRYPNGFSQSDSINRVDQVQPCGESSEPAGVVDALVSDLRQGLGVEAVCLGDSDLNTYIETTPDIYEREGTCFIGEEYDRTRELELASEDDFQRHDQPVLSPREVFSIGR